MAFYNYDDLKGGGVFIAGFSGTQEFIIHSPHFSSYFVLETVRNEEGYYTSSSPINTSGSFASLVNIGNLIVSPYIASFVVNEGTGSFAYTPNVAVANNTLYLRATGKITLEANLVASVTPSPTPSVTPSPTPSITPTPSTSPPP